MLRHVLLAALIAALSLPAAAADPKKRPRAEDADARHCLALGSNAEIIKCAEAYR